MKAHIRLGIAAALVLAGAAPVLLAQDTSSHKPGGLNKVAHNISNTAKKAGRDTKAEMHRDASKAHNALTDAGNGTKTALKKATGIKGSKASKPGGLNAVAHNISNTSKKAASDTKAEVKRTKGKLHGGATETGKSIKDTTFKSKP